MLLKCILVYVKIFYFYWIFLYVSIVLSISCLLVLDSKLRNDEAAAQLRFQVFDLLRRNIRKMETAVKIELEIPQVPFFHSNYYI